MPKNTTYELKLTALTDDGKQIIAFLEPRLPEHFETIAKINAKRRAIQELFGETIETGLISVQRIPARTRRRVLKL